MTAEYPNLTIQIIQFDGNLTTGDTDGIDIEASIEGYCDALYDALTEAYPEATIEIDRENSVGITPRPDVSYDGQHDSGQPWDREERLLTTIEAIASAVYEDGNWWVTTDGDEDGSND